jgi:uncharacterized DUF497 family protein
MEFEWDENKRLSNLKNTGLILPTLPMFLKMNKQSALKIYLKNLANIDLSP